VGVFMQDVKHKSLLVLLTLTIIGEVASIFLWTVNPSIGPQQSVRFTLNVDYTIAVVNAAIMMVLNIMALFWIRKENKWGPIFLIIISVGNRAASHPIFIGGTHLIFVSWTVILVILSYFEYQRIIKKTD
jgi:hypothetical protein